MGFPSSKIAAVAPYTPPRPIPFLVLLAFFDSLQLSERRAFFFCGVCTLIDYALLLGYTVKRYLSMGLHESINSPSKEDKGAFYEKG